MGTRDGLHLKDDAGNYLEVIGTSKRKFIEDVIHRLERFENYLYKVQISTELFP